MLLVARAGDCLLARFCPATAPAAGFGADEELLLRLARQLEPSQPPTQQPVEGAEAGRHAEGGGGALNAYGPSLVGLLEDLQARADMVRQCFQGLLSFLLSLPPCTLLNCWQAGKLAPRLYVA